jgi:hypothetical protein
MKRTVLIRLGGLVAMVGSIAYAMANLALWFSEPPISQIIRHLDRDRTIQTLDNIFFVFLVLGALAAIASLHTLHREFYGMTETVVSLPAFVGMALVLIGGLGDVLGPWWHFTSPTWGFLLAVLGGIGLGALTIAARVLPWWCGAALIVGSLGFLPASLLGELWGVLVGVAWALVGYAIFRAATRQAQQASRVR